MKGAIAMKQKIVAAIVAIASFGSVVSANYKEKIENDKIYSQDTIRSLREIKVKFETSYNARPTAQIELYEGEQVQLVLPDDSDRPEINYVNFSSNECKTAVSHDLKLTGYRKGEDTLKIYIGYKGTEEENYILLKVNITESDMISSENSAKIEKLSEYKGDRGAGFLRKKLELAGIVDKNDPRITLDKAKKIISSSEDFRDIVMQFNRIHGYPDNYYESGDYGYIYWLDENGNEYITLSEQGMAWYGKIADDGTELEFQMLYSSKEITELIDKDEKYKNYYMLYDQLKPVEQVNADSCSLSGDVNCDNEIDMSDVVLIMQALANPNRYGLFGTAEHHLTEQGELNGDMNGDGLTLGDAQAIQLMLLGCDNNNSNTIAI